MNSFWPTSYLRIESYPFRPKTWVGANSATSITPVISPTPTLEFLHHPKDFSPCHIPPGSSPSVTCHGDLRPITSVVLCEA